MSFTPSHDWVLCIPLRHLFIQMDCFYCKSSRQDSQLRLHLHSHTNMLFLFLRSGFCIPGRAQVQSFKAFSKCHATAASGGICSRRSEASPSRRVSEWALRVMVFGRPDLSVYEWDGLPIEAFIFSWALCWGAILFWGLLKVMNIRNLPFIWNVVVKVVTVCSTHHKVMNPLQCYVISVCGFPPSDLMGGVYFPSLPHSQASNQLVYAPIMVAMLLNEATAWQTLRRYKLHKTEVRERTYRPLPYNWLWDVSWRGI